MGSCVSKKAARASAGRGGKVAAPLPVVEKERALPPVVEEEEVKEVVLSETPVPQPPRPLPEPVKRRQQEQPEEEVSEACSASERASVASANEKTKVKAKAGGHQEVEKRALDAPEKGRAKRSPPADESKPKGGAGNGRARSPSPSSAHRRQPGGGNQHPPPAPAPARPRREQPAVVSGFGCRSGRFSPSAARRAAESAVRRSYSAREADMALPAKRSLTAAINGNAKRSLTSGSALTRREPGERSGRRSDSPTAKRPSACPSPVHRPTSPMRNGEKEQGTPERARPWSRDGPDAGRYADERQPGLAGGGGGERKMVAAEGGELGQNPSVAMECFIFL